MDNLQWTKKEPDKPGFYWFLGNYQVPVVVEVYMLNGRLVAGRDCVPVKLYIPGQWAGPIPVPPKTAGS